MNISQRLYAVSASVLWGAMGNGGAWAGDITYSDYVSDVAVVIGNTTYSCASTSDPTCAFASFSATANANTILPFSVPGASGLQNRDLLSASVTIYFNNGQTPFSASLNPSQLFVSVDQTNGGAGFGSMYGPTYPAATYGGSTAYATYNLASDFYVQGYSGFCPDVSLCNSGAPLYTTNGTPITFTYPFRPNFSIFSSQVSSVAEPGTTALLALGLGALAMTRRRRPKAV
jgi:MYXO-CTERM domain-containing protein